MAVAGTSSGTTNGADPVLLSYEPIRTDDEPHAMTIPNFRGSADNLDSYTQGIELSNACRRFYVSRVQVAEGIRSKLDTELASSGHKDLDNSMGKLRKEVVSLIDQDLSLMKQLLTLNERIEELKWQRKLAAYSPASATTCASSANLVDSELGDWDGDSTTLSGTSERLAPPRESDRDLTYSKYLSPSNLSMYRDCTYNSTHEGLHEASSSSDISRTTVVAATHSRLSQQRSTSDLGSSDELVSSVTDMVKSNRLSQADSFISFDCPSNSNSLKKEEQSLPCTGHNYFKTTKLKGKSVYPDSLRGSHRPLPIVNIKVQVEKDDEGDLQEYSHDSGIQDVDHNLEMII